MRKLLASACALLLLLTACSKPAEPTVEDDSLHVLATTYPVYLLTTAVIGDTEGVDTTLLVNQQTSCLHDYTLTVKDMKAVEQADIVIMNGAGLEDFMSDALAHSDADVITCSDNVELLPARAHGHDHDHDHDHGENDPHIWMDPLNATAMAGAVGNALADLDPEHAETYLSNADTVGQQLEDAQQRWTEQLSGLAHPYLITFHDGFQYFAARQGLELLRSIEEEEGSEASAAEIKTIADLVREYELPAIFTERNGSTATAEAIARETGCTVGSLNMIMSGDGTGLQPYLDAMQGNIDSIVEALG